MAVHNNAQLPRDSGGANGESTLGDLFALSDEQILEIEPEAQDASVAQGPSTSLRASASPAGVSAGSTTVAPDHATPSAPPAQNISENAGLPTASGQVPPGATQPATEPGPELADRDVQPPKWLADMMADPQRGGEAKQFWEQTQQAGTRARQLEELDRAYFAGDGKAPEDVAAARERLAETLLREDPAAFREMVFAGLRALGKRGSPDVAQGPSTSLRASGSPAELSSSPQATAQQGTGHAAMVTQYAAFEKAANEDLDRDVGGTIARVLEQALPNLKGSLDSGNVGAQHAAPLQGRLHSAIRQDIEAVLKGDRQLAEQVALIISGKRPGEAGTHTPRFDDATRAQVVRLIGERARQLVPGAAKRVLNDWTQTALAAHRARAQKTEAAAARPDVEGVGGAPANVRTKSASAREVDYRKLSDAQILDL